MKSKNRRRTDAGFTLIETMIALVVLAVGVLALGAMLGDGLAYMAMSQDEYIAEQKAAEAVESVYTARDVGQTTWANINNVSAGGIFTDGATQLCDPGLDGIEGTADDNCAIPDSIWTPGPDGKLGTADDIRIPLSSFTRTILIQPVAGRADLRQVTVSITYTAAKFRRTYTLVTNISQYS
ncbi:MAG TPA: prepilin-type N-terminal cleavage/methylation domain-containing protein [Candidatus Acidoferrales bacterium]